MLAIELGLVTIEPMSRASLDNVLAFTSFTHAIREVRRSMWVRGLEQYENDSEHSFQLALIALYLIDQNALPLNAYKAMGIALVHDIVEVHAGDTFVYGGDTATQSSREADAIRLLRQQWPDQHTMLALIDEYEARKSPEAMFVYALDKLIPILNNILDDGRNWLHEGITLGQLKAAKSKKISSSSEIKYYYDLVLNLLEKKPELLTPN